MNLRCNGRFARVVTVCAEAIILLLWMETAALGYWASRWTLPEPSYPRPGTILFQDAEIWIRRVERGRLPHLLRGRTEIPLTLVGHHALSDERDDRDWPIDRYRPSVPFKPGTYLLRFVALPNPTRKIPPLDRTFVVRRGKEPKPPPVPRVLRSSYHMFDREPIDPNSPWASEIEQLDSMRQVQFDVRVGEGMLVADFGRADEDPLDNLILDAPDSSGVLDFPLGSPGFGLRHADYCTRSRVRFGAWSAAGRFSGWTAWQEINFPTRSDGTCPEAPSAAPLPAIALPAAALLPEPSPPVKTKEPRRPLSHEALVLLGVALSSLVVLIGWHLHSIRR